MKNFLFGKKDKTPSPDAAAKELKECLDTLEKRQTYLQDKADLEHEKAKSLAQTNKEQALRALKRRRGYLKNIRDLDVQIINVEKHLETLEQTHATKHLMNAMQQSTMALKSAVSEKEIEAFQDYTDQYEDIKARMDEFQLVLERQAQSSGYDDDELLAELEALDQEQLDKSLAKVTQVIPELPSAPKTEVVKQVPMKDEDFVRQLQDWSNMDKESQ